MTNVSPFIKGQIYRRGAIQDKYGGTRQGGIAPTRNYDFIFIFSGGTGHTHGYRDGWENQHVYSYTGEGRIGDMKFVRGNLALRNHKENNKRVFLFEADGRGSAKYIDEVEVFDTDYFETHDTEGNNRIAIKFFFKRVGDYVPEILNPQPDQTIIADPLNDYGFKRPNETEKKGLVTSRIGQGAYRKSVIHRWEYQCAVTGFNKLNILIASHIVPWSKSTNDERLDTHNGILLSPTYDALFDRHLISFENSGKIILSDKIEFNSFTKLGVTGNERIKNFRSDNHSYLDRHRIFFHEANH